MRQDQELDLLVIGGRLLVAQGASVVVANPLWKLRQRAGDLVGEVLAGQALRAHGLDFCLDGRLRGGFCLALRSHGRPSMTGEGCG